MDRAKMLALEKPPPDINVKYVMKSLFLNASVTTETSTNGTAIAAGDVLYWDASGKKVTKTSSGNTRIGIAANAMSSAGTSVDVIL